MLEKIIKEAKYVELKSNDVKINYEKLDSFIDNASFFESKHYLLSNSFGIMNLSNNQVVNFLLLYDAINFSFWGNPKWKVMTENGTIDGSYALLYVLFNFLKNEENFFYKISSISFEELASIFSSDIEIPLLDERVEILKQVSQIVINKFNGEFYNAIESINNDNDLFDLIISSFPNFKDERVFKGHVIPFYKLAQLLVSDILQIREYKEGIHTNYSNLVGCADYKIPQILRKLGIINYSDILSNIINNKEEIKENSSYEVEIRANTLVVIDYISKKLPVKINRINVNDFIWLLGQKNTGNIKPYHLTRTANY